VTHFSITEVSDRYKIPRKTIESAVQRKYLKSFQNSKKEHFIPKDDAEYYVNGPTFPLWWSFQQIATLKKITIEQLYSLKDSAKFKHTKWKGKIYALISGEEGIEADLVALGVVQCTGRMIQMEKPVLEE
jgi:hypothetical protein